MLSASLTIALRFLRFLLGHSPMMAGTLRADGRESTSLDIGTEPGSPGLALLPGGPLAVMKVSPRWKGSSSNL